MYNSKIEKWINDNIEFEKKIIRGWGLIGVANCNQIGIIYNSIDYNLVINSPKLLITLMNLLSHVPNKDELIDDNDLKEIIIEAKKLIDSIINYENHE